MSFLYPECCQLCLKQPATPAAGYVCGDCREGLQFIEPPYCSRCGLPSAGAITHEYECSNCRMMGDVHFTYARSVVAAKGVALEIIHRYKYQRALWFEPLLAGLLIDAARLRLREEEWDLVVPVPLHPRKEAEREFNQAVRLGRRLTAATNLRLSLGAVRRVVSTPTQTQLSVAERAENVRRAFAPGPRPEECKGRRVVLVDDVFTTGSTTSSCARVLRECGAEKVCVWTVARGLLQ